MKAEPNSSGRILDAALTLFSERGYDATSTREICELAGITKPSLYYFYESKEIIYRALIRSAMEDFHRLLEEGLLLPGDLRTRLTHTARMVFDHAKQKPRLWRLMYASVHSLNSQFLDEFEAPYHGFGNRLSHAFEAAIAAGEIKPGDPGVRALVLMGAIGESVSNSLLFGKPKLTPQLAQAIMDTLFCGWLATKA
jgi:TetR/AcrR family transcriptional regulator